MSLVKYALIVVGLIAIYCAFDRLSIRQFHRERLKHGENFRPAVGIPKWGYVVMALYFVAVALIVPGSGSSDSYDPCIDTGMRC